ncbi:MAG: TIR domain-containing protein [Candidatus Hodarchaeota archaeon]
MSSIPTYKYDIFISYASVDNLTTQDSKQGWVAKFKENLEISLSKRVGRIGAVKIWWGPVVKGNQVFDDTIKDAIDASKLFIALTSNGYMASDYCKKELDWFYQKAKKESIGLTIGDCSRIFNVLLNNIHHENWLPEFVGTSGFPMNDATNADTFSGPSKPDNDLFKVQLGKLVDAIFRLLTHFKEISFEEKHINEMFVKPNPNESQRILTLK